MNMSEHLIDAIDDVLPQTQCRQCGYDGCRNYAWAIAMGEAPINRCAPGGQKGIEALAQVTGKPVLALDPEYGHEVPLEVSHINPDMFEQAFRPYAKRGDSVIYLCFSTGIAGTYNAANLAKQAVLEDYPDFDLTIIDSKSASIGFGLIVYKLLLMQEHGAGKETLIRAANFYIAHIHHVFTVRTLKYLIKGGRLSRFKGTAGEFLDMKPVLIVDRDGALTVLKTVRGRKKSLKSLVEYVEEHIFEPSRQIMGICHGEDRESLEFTKEALLSAVQPKELVETVLGCAIGAHTGRGIIGIVFFDALDDEFEAYVG